ncbi:HET-domain-containing protein [Whalleya microplaca]|nr:HET-domain-containing protein [Whalleya microplaca]
MPEDLDKTINRKSGFKYRPIDSKAQVRLLRISYGSTYQDVNYKLETFRLADLSSTFYRALSYTWGHAPTIDDVREIQVDGQPFHVRRNLFDFLATAAGKGEGGLFFIDAICINQLDDDERQFQVREMTRIYRHSSRVVAWLGSPGERDLDKVQALSQIEGTECTNWTAKQWEGMKYLSYHEYWNRVWVVQEVLLAPAMSVWCGFFSFPLLLFARASPAPISTSMRSRGSLNTLSRRYSPAQRIISHRTRVVPRPVRDVLAQGTEVGTLAEMTAALSRPHTIAETYQSSVPDLVHEVVRKFGMLACSDPRDKLYGFLGLLKDASKAQVRADYTRDVRYAYRQALKLGLEEIYREQEPVVPGDWSRQSGYGEYLTYFREACDAFGMEEAESVDILSQVVVELGLDTRLMDAMADAQHENQFQWNSVHVRVAPDLKEIVELAKPAPRVRDTCSAINS